MPETHMHNNEHDDINEKNKRALEFIEDVTINAGDVQNKVLTEILTQNANVEYLRRYELTDEETNKEKFKKLIPVVTYEDLAPDIERIANGDTSHILSSRPISEFLTSSGTSGGERKLMPTIEDELDRRSLLYSLLMPVMSQYIPDLEKGKGMYFLFVKSESTTPGGLYARPVLTSYYKSKHFKNRKSDSYTNYTSPYETIICLDSFQSVYSQMLCGLYQNNEVVRVGAVFASAFIRAIKFLETHWESLCHDIRTGTISQQIIDPDVKEAVMRIVSPNPPLADLIESECIKDSWRGIIRRLWPNVKYIEVIVTGTMAQYIPTLDYYGDGLPLASTMYASSECYFGLNLNPLAKPSEVTYTILPTMAYFEFFPVNKNEDVVENDELIDLVDVKLGQEYELVITTYSGLYRYRVGDILRVAGFKNKAPQFRFMCRKNVALSIDSDKTDEVELHNAVTNALKHLTPFHCSLIEYTSYADTSSIPGHYVLFWEISHKNKDSHSIPNSELEECCLTIEESLNSVYRQCRTSDKAIGPLEIRVVENGSFDALMDFALGLGASINQYKVPRCVTYAPMIELLNSRVVSCYFSPRSPVWVPAHEKRSSKDQMLR